MKKRPAYLLLDFTRKEKNGTIFLLLIILCLMATPFIYSLVFKEKPVVERDLENGLSRLKAVQADSTVKNYKPGRYDDQAASDPFPRRSETARPPVSLFYFDPNNLSADGWKKLGLREKTVETIQHYLSKGGKFRAPDDLKKIWGIREEQLKLLLPYVRIAQQPPEERPKSPYEKIAYPEKKFVMVDVNAGDSLAFVSLPGIGPGFAKRILRYRDRLGGFYNKEQVAETFGLPDSTWQKIKNHLNISGENIRKININKATFEELKEHPYIRYQLGNAIIQFRTQHGNFLLVNDLKKMMLMTDELFAKIAPYVSVE